jgi:hypothetical protein
MKKRNVSATPLGSLDPPPHVADRDYPNLHEAVAHQFYEDGTRREKSSILITYDGGVFKGMIKDRDLGQCLWVSAPCLTEVFMALEVALTDEGADWRADRFAPGSDGVAKRVKR